MSQIPGKSGSCKGRGDEWSPAGSVTRLVERLERDGDPHAAQEFVNHFWKRVVGLARKTLNATGTQRGIAASDVAQEALTAFFVAIEKGQFRELKRRDRVWALLATLTRNEANELIRHERAKKRGGGNIRHDSVLPILSDGNAAQWADIAVDSSPDPAELVENAELCAHTMVQVCEKLFPQLSPEEMHTVVLVAEHGIRQAAKILDRPESTIRVRYKKIVHGLKQAVVSEP